MEYFDEIKNKIDEVYNISNNAKKNGSDFFPYVEIPIALSMAEKVVNLVATIYPQINNEKITNRILELEKEYGKLDSTIVFKIADEISNQKYCEFDNNVEAMDAGIRVGFAYLTLGVVSSPIEGYTGLDIGKRSDGKDYIIANFSGPIRSAGTTASCVVLILIDFLRKKFGYKKYDPTEEEKKRMFLELYDFNTKITNLQYMPTEEEIDFIASNLGFQISGDPSEKKEISNYKKLERINTDFLRSGVCLVLGEGLSQKAPKGLRLLNNAKKNGIKYDGFDWLSDYVKIHEKNIFGKIEGDVATYMKDLVAGRPVFSYPSRSGGFRFRYGRSRNSGFSSVSINPSTMKVLNDSIAIGTQLKIEKPSKGCVATSCDYIEGPIVKLKNGSLKKINTIKDYNNLENDIEEIIYVGDLLFPYSDVLNRNSDLIKPGYVQEWWALELEEKGVNENIDYYNLSIESAIEFSKKYSVPLHPDYIFYWTQIGNEKLFSLIEWLKESRINSKIILPWSSVERKKFDLGKRALELLGVPHDVFADYILVDEINSKALLVNLGLDKHVFGKDVYLRNYLEDFSFGSTVLETINLNCNYEVKDKAGDFIGARMGRPEKAKLRKIPGSPNSLFVVGREGGRLKTFKSAIEAGKSTYNFPIFYCDKCERETVFSKCEMCSTITKRKFYFRDVDEYSFFEKNEESNFLGVPYKFRSIDIKHYFENAKKNLGISENEVEVVKGMFESKSSEKIMEPIEKGILRAKHGLFVNKDGTIRLDATELSLTHFKPAEIGVGHKKLRELGYLKDIYGNDLTNDEQIMELMPHDVLIPAADENPDEKGDDVFMKICNFVDDLLVKYYKVSSFYNIKKREDLIGHMGVCMAPHNCGGVACRFIGFSNTLGIMASPFMHAAIRRDCDGDEMSIMLLGDVLLNFSKKYLPNRRGGTQDAPLVLNAKIDAGEVDDQILDLECVTEYPLDLYKKAEERKHSSDVNIRKIKDVLKEGKNPFLNIGYTHDVFDFNSGVRCSSYKIIEDMKEKVDIQMDLAEKIRAVDSNGVAKAIIEKHFLRDTIGNLNRFSSQGFRCVECNSIMRRPPLNGVCSKCGGKLIFTINEGGIRKYLNPAINLAKKYDVGEYLNESLMLLKDNVESIFGEKKEDTTLDE